MIRRFRVTPALKTLFEAQIESRIDSSESAGISIWRKISDATPWAELTPAEADELREELQFFLMPDVESTGGERRTARAALAQLRS
jgi:hypothetical protein